MYRAWGKRIFDLVFVVGAVTALSPVMLIVAVMIKIFDPGPVFFQQPRIGRAGRIFRFYKFRSMPVGTVNISSDAIGQIKLSPIGRFIRRTNLDELPQLYNILKGDMSVVGPRPPLPSQTQLIAARNANGAIACNPGLTGLAQVNSFDGMSVEQKAEFDGNYAASITFYRDICIIMKTFIYLLKPPPVY